MRHEIVISLSPELMRVVNAALASTGVRQHLEEQILATEQELVTAVTGLLPAIDGFMTGVDAAIAKAVGDALNKDDPALTTLVTSVQAEHDKLVAATVPAAAAVDATPPAAPTQAQDAVAAASGT